MPQNLILLPVAAQVFLTLGVLIVLGRRRRLSMLVRKQKIQDMATARDVDWDKPALVASNNFKNQFELPVLFYAGTAFILITRNVDPLLFGLAVLFVLSRYIHAIVHLGPNIVHWRGISYLVGFAALSAMWIVLVIRVLRSELG